MAEDSEHLTHPVFGTLGWLPQYSHWFAQPTLASGVQLDLVVDPGDGDRFEFLPRAAELYRWALANERAVLAEAVATKLLELYSGGWQQDDLPVLDAAGLTARMSWEFLQVSASEVVPIDFGYNPGDLFWGHTVAVEVGPDLRFRGAHLIG
jgi:hypothetical protein